jgi:hypothetical protein
MHKQLLAGALLLAPVSVVAQTQPAPAALPPASAPVVAAPAPAASETLTNATVIQLVKAGLGNDAVIAKIKATPGKYDLNTADLIALKDAGVPGDVIAAMIAGPAKVEAAPVAMSLTDINPMTPHPSGLYLIDTPAYRLDRIDPTVSNQAKTGGRTTIFATLRRQRRHLRRGRRWSRLALPWTFATSMPVMVCAAPQAVHSTLRLHPNRTRSPAVRTCLVDIHAA